MIPFSRSEVYQACLLAEKAYSAPTFKTGNAQGIIVEFGEYLWIILAGTNDFKDVLEDLDCAPINHSFLGGISKGFGEYADASLAVVEPLIEGTKKRLVLVGHSLGGPDAQFLLAIFAQTGYLVEGCITFNSPRGWISGVHFESLGLQSLNIIHGTDVISKLPSWGTRPGQDVFLSSTGKELPTQAMARFWPPWQPIIDWWRDHEETGRQGTITAVKAWAYTARTM